MAATLPDRQMFPAVPAHSAEWAAVYLEPMLGSGERLVAAIVCVDLSGAFHVELTLRSKVLHCMYGERGELVMGIAELVQETLQDHLAIGGSLQNWISPIATCFMGAVRNAVGGDLENIARRGAMLTASLSGPGQEVVAPGADMAVIAPDVDRWLQQIRASVRARHEPFDVRFNGEVVVRPGASPTKIGYLGDRIAVNFDALVPGPNLSTRRFRSKARLIDLQILRDQVDHMIKRSSYELMLWVPEKNSPAFSQRYLDSAYAALSELEEFGDKHDLRVQRLQTADAAADRIVAAETAGSG